MSPTKIDKPLTKLELLCEIQQLRKEIAKLRRQVTWAKKRGFAVGPQSNRKED